MIFKKIRYLTFAYVSKFFAWLLVVELPPVLSVTAIIFKDGKILTLKLSYYDGYGLPGGLVSGDEDLETAVRREVFEETGLTVTSLHLLGSVSVPFKGIDSITVAYQVETKGEIVDSVEGSLEWLAPEEVHQKLVYPNAQLVLEKYFLNHESHRD
ncbi:MAG: NUDIX hydrolase [Patescibacteria group bacterium]